MLFAVNSPEQPHQQRRQECVFMHLVEAGAHKAHREDICDRDEEQRNALEAVLLRKQIGRNCAAHCKDRLQDQQRGFLRCQLIERHPQIIDIGSMDPEMRDRILTLTGRDRGKPLDEIVEHLHEQTEVMRGRAEDQMPLDRQSGDETCHADRQHQCNHAADLRGDLFIQFQGRQLAEQIKNEHHRNECDRCGHIGIVCAPEHCGVKEQHRADCDRGV